MIIRALWFGSRDNKIAQSEVIKGPEFDNHAIEESPNQWGINRSNHLLRGFYNFHPRLRQQVFDIMAGEPVLEKSRPCKPGKLGEFERQFPQMAIKVDYYPRVLAAVTVNRIKNILDIPNVINQIG
ncbi:hypothetical protein TspCOW1_04830 [Thiohalobacter sp. COW1]|nr:hypothetical protein TspCOW1_04830 [Thiohalobacter sp. COW1]